jgi:hypothetical protein
MDGGNCTNTHRSICSMLAIPKKKFKKLLIPKLCQKEKSKVKILKMQIFLGVSISHFLS